MSRPQNWPKLSFLPLFRYRWHIKLPLHATEFLPITWKENAIGTDTDKPVQQYLLRMKFVQPGSPLPIHRHQKSSETMVCLRGRLQVEFYDELERICTERIELSPNGPVVALNIPAGQWHTARALESGTVIMEMKDGKYEPTSPVDILK